MALSEIEKLERRELELLERVVAMLTKLIDP